MLTSLPPTPKRALRSLRLRSTANPPAANGQSATASRCFLHCYVPSPCPSRAFFLFIEEIARFSEEIAQLSEKHTNGPKFVVPLSRLDRERGRCLWGFVAVPMASRSGLSGLFAPWGWQGIQPPAPHPTQTTPRPPAAAPFQVQTKSPQINR